MSKHEQTNRPTIKCTW